MCEAAPSHSGHHTLFFSASSSLGLVLPVFLHQKNLCLALHSFILLPICLHCDIILTLFYLVSLSTLLKIIPSGHQNYGCPACSLTHFWLWLQREDTIPCTSQPPTSSVGCDSQFFCLQVLSKVNRQAVTLPFSFLFEESKLVNWPSLNLLKLMKRSPLLETSQYFNAVYCGWLVTNLQTDIDQEYVPDWQHIFWYPVQDKKVGSYPGWCGSVNWMLACEPKICRFKSQSGHMPGLQARSPVGGIQEAAYRYISYTLLVSLPLFLPPFPGL